ncbi:hypothetical protein D4T05_26895 [Salmonella enterica]|nr:hypothetical protein [Salmonella enterica subsp. enterica serovar Java]EAP0945760.1 hypothetical protein [Salmonella enterica]ECJ4483966.1 hypothetical protein [Salmonella enterica subsp. diarizonae]EAP0951159.1 hypothetical protein [Salmonella enterica]EBK1151674.1 hypothetical protein [Salmonella enterica]
MNTPETDTAVSFLSSFFIYNQFRNEYQNIVIYERVNNRFNSVFFSVSFMVVCEKNKNNEQGEITPPPFRFCPVRQLSGSHCRASWSPGNPVRVLFSSSVW